MTWNGLLNPNRKWALCFTVSGLDTRYYDIAAPPTTTIHNTTAQYVDRPMLLDVSGVNDTYNIEGGVAEHSAHTITLATRGKYAEDEYDPGVVFGRLTNRSAAYASRVTSSISQTSTTAIVVEDDPTGLSMPRLIHIDGESFWVTSTAGSPFRFLGVTRGAARTPQQPHTVDETFVDYPEVTTEVVHWRTRWATIYAAPVYDSGETGDWIELVHGFIDTTPEVDTAGNTVTIQLAPMTALLDNELAPPQGSTTKTGLLRGYHEFHYPYASTVEHVQHFLRGAFSFSGQNATSVAGLIPHAGANSEPWTAAHDFTLLNPGHPRQGTFDVGGGGGDQYVIGASGTNFTAPAMPAGLPVTQVYSVAEREVHRRTLTTPLAPTVLRWPNEVFELLSVTTGTGWTAAQIADGVGITGSWMQVSLDASRSKITCERNNSITLPFLRFAWQTQGRQYFTDGDDALYWGVSPPESTPAFQRLRYPFLFPGFNPNQLGFIDVDVPGRTRDIDIITPYAFYQAGEPYILVSEDIDIPTSGSLDVRLKYRKVDNQGNAGDEDTRQFKVTASTAVTYGGSTVGYRLTIDPRFVDSTADWNPESSGVPSFGDWPGVDSPEITAVATWDSVSSAKVMTQLLTSSGGNTVNGPEDVLPFGAALPGSIAPSYTAWGAAEFVDINSFFNFPGPAAAESWTLFYEGGETLRDIVDSIGRATSTLIVMQRRADGSCRLRRVPVAADGAYESVGSITEGEWLADRPPTSGVDDRVVSRHVYKINHDENGEAQLPVTIIDNRALRTHGEASTYELDIRGLKLEDSGGDAPQLALRPIYSRISRILGDERRLWRGRVSTAKAALMQLGAVYTITSSHLRGYSDFIGVSGETARLKSLAFDITGEGADVEFVYLAQNATGWNAALNIVSVSSATIVIVSNTFFAGVNNPASGDLQSDVDFFAPGDTVRCVPTADHDAFVTTTIDQINVDVAGVSWEVEFTGAHGITAPLYGTVEPATYPNAASQHDTLAYLADATPDLNGDPAQEIS